MSVLHLLILVPLIAAIAILLGAPPRKTSVYAAALQLFLSVITLAGYDHSRGGFQFVASVAAVPELDLKYLVGADGLSLLLLLLTAVVTLASICVTPKVDKMEDRFYACLLFISAGATGAFASLDLFFFYAFHELALIPTFLLIGIWGQGARQAAAWKITIYLALGSFVLLIGLIGVYLTAPLGERTFDLQKLYALAAANRLETAGSGNWIYPCLLLGFGILVSLFPFHTWAPQAYAAAPTPVAMLHAGVLKKFGLYGLIRVAVPLLPEAARQWTGLLLALLVGNLLYIGFVTIAQKRLDLMLGYSSVMHMGYIFLGVASLNIIGLTGASLLMFAHGLSIAALFALSGEIQRRAGTLVFSELGGLGQRLPWLSFVFGLAAFASLGLPGFGNFASEIMVMFGAWKGHDAGRMVGNFQFVTIAALWGVVISAVYTLRAYRAIFLGPLDPRCKDLTEVGHSWRAPVMMLLALLLLSGVYPQLFVSYLAPGLQALLR